MNRPLTHEPRRTSMPAEPGQAGKNILRHRDILRQWREQGGKEMEERKWLQIKAVTKDEFKFIKKLGEGFYGPVELVKNAWTGNLYAMKSVERERGCEDIEVIKRLTTERMVLLEVNSVWIIRMFHSFQDAINHYLLLEYIPGGSVKELLRREGNLMEEKARIYGAEMLLGINALHRHGFMHRNLSPENFLIDATGHLKISDFGQAFRFLPLETCLKLASESSFDQEGRPRISNERRDRIKLYQRRARGRVGRMEYMSPEMIKSAEKSAGEILGFEEGRHYGFTTDFWSFGVCLYFLLFGVTPFRGKKPKHKILNWRQTIEYPIVQQISDEAKDLLSSLLRNEQFRLGLYGCEDVMRHAFFEDTCWTQPRENALRVDEGLDPHDWALVERAEPKPLYARTAYLQGLVSHLHGGPVGFMPPYGVDIGSLSALSGGWRGSLSDENKARPSDMTYDDVSVPNSRRTSFASHTKSSQASPKSSSTGPTRSIARWKSRPRDTKGVTDGPVHEKGGEAVLDSTTLTDLTSRKRQAPPSLDRSEAGRKFMASNRRACVCM